MTCLARSWTPPKDFPPNAAMIIFRAEERERERWSDNERGRIGKQRNNCASVLRGNISCDSSGSRSEEKRDDHLSLMHLQYRLSRQKQMFVAVYKFWASVPSGRTKKEGKVEREVGTGSSSKDYPGIEELGGGGLIDLLEECGGCGLFGLRVSGVGCDLGSVFEAVSGRWGEREMSFHGVEKSGKVIQDLCICCIYSSSVNLDSSGAGQFHVRHARL